MKTNLIQKVSQGWESITNGKQNLATSSDPVPWNQKSSNKVLPWQEKAIYRMRLDIKDWNQSVDLYNYIDPKTYGIQLIFDNIEIDALLTSQIENRINQSLSCNFSLKDEKGEIDVDQTKLLKTMPAFEGINKAILNSRYYGYSLVELSLVKLPSGQYSVEMVEIPRTNVVPKTGRFYPDYLGVEYIEYRNLNEYGTYILEFDSKELGLLNKAVPHILMKRFAQSCWSELCEIHGIPPRILKTNTQDTAALNKAYDMMRDSGAGTYYIVDITENFEFGSGINYTGEVFEKLITLCSNETSMLISGAIIGQDTKNGSNSKDQNSQSKLDSLVSADKVVIEKYWNTTIIPALKKLGVLKASVQTFEFDPVEDLNELWTRTKDTMQYMEVDPEFVKNKFGVEVIGQKATSPAGTKLSFGESFFV